MKSRKAQGSTSRRDFLAAATAAGIAASPISARARNEAEEQNIATEMKAAPPSVAQINMEREVPAGYSMEQAENYFVQKPSSDFMVDVIRSLNIEYIATNSGSSFRGLHESIVTYGNNQNPEMLTCLHEEQACAMAHGYFKATGKVMAVACHGTVGIQHAAMALYNAWCDQVPVVVIGGNHVDAAHRRTGVEWAHSAQDAVAPVRNFVKWDDAPGSLQHFAESLVRAYRIALTPPMGPVAIIVDGPLQEAELPHPAPSIPGHAPILPPVGDSNGVKEAARMLVEAEFPVIVADRLANSQEGMNLLVELAEALQAPVIDQGGRMNFPTNHYLNHGMGMVAKADVILGLELWDTYGTINQVRDRVHRDSIRRARPDAKVISIGASELFTKSNYQNFQRYYASDLSIAGQAQATLPSLLEQVRRLTPTKYKRKFAARKQELESAYASKRKRDLEEARYAWHASPISTARLSMEIWDLIKEKDWSLVSVDTFQSRWPHRLWTMDKYHQYNGESGAHGLGYGAASAVGAALGHQESGRVAVNIQADGDLMYVPGIYWTAAHHRIPLLSVMHNNRGYQQETLHLQRMAVRRQRGVTGNARIGNALDDPDIDFSGLAASMGVWSTGPVTEPGDLRPALRDALAVVEQGEPALVDVICQPR